MSDQRVDDDRAAAVPSGPAQQTGRSSRQRGLGSIALIAALCVAVGGLAFAAGRLTAPQPSRGAGFQGFGGRGFGGSPAASGAPFGPGGAFRSLVLEGTVTAVANGRLSLQLPSGATVEVEIGSATIHQQAPAGPADLTVGSNVLVLLSGAGSAGGAPGGPPASPGPSGERQLGAAADVTILRR
jgi:hypothetical protein